MVLQEKLMGTKYGATAERTDPIRQLRILVADVGHKVTPEQRRAALEWLERWLK